MLKVKFYNKIKIKIISKKLILFKTLFVSKTKKLIILKVF